MTLFIDWIYLIFWLCAAVLAVVIIAFGVKRLCEPSRSYHHECDCPDCTEFFKRSKK
jgi:hypothetical protein